MIILFGEREREREREREQWKYQHDVNHQVPIILDNDWLVKNMSSIIKLLR